MNIIELSGYGRLINPILKNIDQKSLIDAKLQEY